MSCILSRSSYILLCQSFFSNEIQPSSDPMNQISTLSFLSANAILGAAIVVVIASPFLTPWQLFQQLCPYFNAQSPQCTMLQQQLQQQQQPATSSPYTSGAPSTSPFSSLPGFPSSSSSVAPAPSP
jgi:hypothetical protein